MANKPSFQMTQGLDVLTPKSGNAYPIPCEEWDHLKTKIQTISHRFEIYQIIGSVFLGASASITIALSTNSYTEPDRIAAIAAVSATLICGIMAIIFDYQKGDVTAEKARDVLALMILIEKRFDWEEKDNRQQRQGRQRKLPIP